MNPNAMRGTIMVAVLVLLGAVILGMIDSGADSFEEVAVAAPTPEVAGTPTPDPFATQVAVTPTPVAIAHSPAEVTVQVANASGMDGVAGKHTEKLAGQGYVTGNPTNGSPTQQVSIVYYKDGYEGDAREIITNVFNAPATQLQLMVEPPSVVEAPDAAANVIMVVGGDALASS